MCFRLFQAKLKKKNGGKAITVNLKIVKRIIRAKEESLNPELLKFIPS